MLAAQVAPAFAEPCLRGVNLSGAEFGKLPGKPNFDYAYPAAEAFQRVAKLGATAVRLPFRWERLQPKLNGAFDKDELKRLDEAVDAGEKAGLSVILNLHNFGQFNEKSIGTEAVPVSAFADFWARFARRYKNRPTVVFSLMNEPFDIQASEWAKAQDAALGAIRRTGALQFVLLTGTAYSGAHSWSSELRTGRNDLAMLTVADPLGRSAIDLHQYLDADFSGRSSECSGAERALKAIDDVGAWLKANDRRGFLGEFAASDRPDCIAAMKALVGKLNAAPDRWIGWTAWGAGAWWPADYPFTLEPTAAGERPQANALKELMSDPGVCDLGSRS